ncbi:MAG: high potential iron sulfur protein [Hyphomicrobiaceae bacterium]|nr:high potential iron sulfur protein [Hyphomicrobiaceae bacterium]
MQEKKVAKSDLTRRGFFGRAALTIAGGAALMVAGTRNAAAKVSKMSAKYKSAPQKGKSCKGCKRFDGTDKCSTVAGKISPNGYCRYYSRKSAYRGSRSY